MIYPPLDEVLPSDARARSRCLDLLAAPVPAGRETMASEWLSLEELPSHLDLMRQWLSQEASSIAAPSQRVAVSLLYKRFCLDVLAPIWLRAAVEGTQPELPSSAFWLRWDERRGCVAVAYESSGGPACLLEERILFEHLRELIARLRVLFHPLGIGNNSFWSSTALALVQPWSRLRGEVADERLARAATDVLGRIDPRLQQYLRWQPVTLADGTQKVQLRRRGCCLKCLLPREVRCGTCGRK